MSWSFGPFRIKENGSVIFIPIILIGMLIAGTFAFVFKPLFEAADGRWAQTDIGLASTTVDELTARRDAIYAGLKDADFDRETGKLAEEDYQVVRQHYMSEAAHILRQLDELTPEAEAALDAEIETAVAALRSNDEQASTNDEYPADMIQTVEAEVASLIKHSAMSDKRALACPDCGQSYRPGDTFCAACGASLADICPQCGAPRRPDDAFCSRCGAPLNEAIRSTD
jgi:hypothetical protein